MSRRKAPADVRIARKVAKAARGAKRAQRKLLPSFQQRVNSDNFKNQ
jgi:hypothetical protein